ncbi:hypothetical protein PCANC_15458, partial [Puccinia coronata f. sp. avenae]
MLVLREALYVPNITRNLLSLVQLVQHAAHIVASPTGFTVQIDGHQILEVDTSNLIFEMVGITHAPQEATANLTVVPQPAKESLTHFKDVHAPLQAIHANLVGPISPPTNAGARYFMTIVDQYSSHIHINILVNKSNALEAITKYKATIENQTNLTIKKLISDGGGEFVSGALSKILASAGIKHIILLPYTPQHNGYAERANQT